MMDDEFEVDGFSLPGVETLEELEIANQNPLKRVTLPSVNFSRQKHFFIMMLYPLFFIGLDYYSKGQLKFSWTAIIIFIVCLLNYWETSLDTPAWYGSFELIFFPRGIAYMQLHKNQISWYELEYSQMKWAKFRNAIPIGRGPYIEIQPKGYVEEHGQSHYNPITYEGYKGYNRIRIYNMQNPKEVVAKINTQIQL